MSSQDAQQQVSEDEKSSSKFPPAPEGGLRAWIVAASGACIFFSTLGFANSFGTFEQYYLSHQLHRSSASKVSWIGSLSAFLQFFAGMFGGPLFDRYGAKVSFNLLGLRMWLRLTFWYYLRLFNLRPSCTFLPS